MIFSSSYFGVIGGHLLNIDDADPGVGWLQLQTSENDFKVNE